MTRARVAAAAGKKGRSTAHAKQGSALPAGADVTASGNTAPRAGKRVAAPLSDSTALGQLAPGRRYQALLKARETILKRIAAKTRDRDRLRNNVAEVEQALGVHLPPIAARGQQLDKAIHALFAEVLLATAARRARRLVASVYEQLQQSGVITPRALGDEEEDATASEWDDEESEPPPRRPKGRPDGSHEADERGPSARAGAGLDALKAIFRRVAAALHPDRVQDDAQKAERTQAMKNLSQAYENGDLARVLAIEAQWASMGVVQAEQPSEEARLSALERVLFDLNSQLKSLDQEVRSLRQQSPLFVIAGIRPRSRAEQAVAIEELILRAKAEVSELEEVHAFVAAFAEGKISLQRFVDGPRFSRRRQEQLADALESLASDLLNDLEPPRRRGRRRRA